MKMVNNTDGIWDEWPPDEIERLKQRCHKDVVFWIDEYCYTYNLKERNPHVRFRLYKYQKRLARRLVEKIKKGEDLLIEKSRDMGVSWLVLLVFQWFWLFEPGSAFLLGSRKLDFVDRKGDMSTLMEKLRYNLAHLPPWMVPQGYDPKKHGTLLKMVNPENGNTITGESGNPNFSRGGRYRAVLMDEFAYWQNDDLAFASAGQATDCRIVVSTPHGRANKFAELRFESPIARETVHWREHPQKTPAWYEKQKSRMTEDEVARELDINYNLSSRDRVFREFNVHHKREIEYNRFIPVIRSWDFGYHCPAVLFLQVDPFGRLLVLHEEMGDRIRFDDFIDQVQAAGERLFPGARYEDYADPAGSQRSDKSDFTNLEILAQRGIYPVTNASLVHDGIEIIRKALGEMIEELPAVMVHQRCKKTIAALEGGYRYNPYTERPINEHPYTDLMDCLRYAAIHKLGLLAKEPRRRNPHYYKPTDPYTNY